MAHFLAATMGVSLVIYTLTAGADFGAGFWLLGARSSRHLKLIEHALAPIWEANHVWLIFIVVVLFGAFPPAFALLATQLHAPLSAVLVGTVLRGTAFIFQAYDPRPGRGAQRWQRVFAVFSVFTPFALGIVLASVASGAVRPDGDFVSAWWRPFPFFVGAFVTALFAMLSAVYLTNETSDPELQNDFRRRAIVMEIFAGYLSALCLWGAKDGAPGLYAFLVRDSWGLALQAGAFSLASGTVWLLVKKRFRWAQMSVMLQVAVVVGGLLLGEYPMLVPPTISIDNAAAEAGVLWNMGLILILGLPILLPSFGWLYFVFKFKGSLRQPSKSVRAQSAPL